MSCWQTECSANKRAFSHSWKGNRSMKSSASKTGFNLLICLEVTVYFALQVSHSHISSVWVKAVSCLYYASVCHSSLPALCILKSSVKSEELQRLNSLCKAGSTIIKLIFEHFSAVTSDFIIWVIAVDSWKF